MLKDRKYTIFCVAKGITFLPAHFHWRCSESDGHFVILSKGKGETVGFGGERGNFHEEAEGGGNFGGKHRWSETG